MTAGLRSGWPPPNEALPWLIARQPLRAIGACVAQMHRQDTAQAHARARFPAITSTVRSRWPRTPSAEIIMVIAIHDGAECMSVHAVAGLIKFFRQ